jgi:hypothetical protein
MVQDSRARLPAPFTRPPERPRPAQPPPASSLRAMPDSPRKEAGLQVRGRRKHACRFGSQRCRKCERENPGCLGTQQRSAPSGRLTPDARSGSGAPSPWRSRGTASRAQSCDGSCPPQRGRGARCAPCPRVVSCCLGRRGPTHGPGGRRAPARGASFQNRPVPVAGPSVTSRAILRTLDEPADLGSRVFAVPPV